MPTSQSVGIDAATFHWSGNASSYRVYWSDGTTTDSIDVDTSLNNGWIVTDYTNGFTIEAQRQNELVSMLIYLASDYKDGSATIEYYEDSDTPTFTKQITWSEGWGPFF